MKIQGTSFGSITIDGTKYDHDVVIFPKEIMKRKKSITKEKHGTSHKFTQEELAEYLDKVDTSQIKVVVVGTGQYGKLGLLDGAKELLKEENIKLIERKTPDAIKTFEEWEEPRENKLGIFHVTC